MLNKFIVTKYLSWFWRCDLGFRIGAYDQINHTLSSGWPSITSCYPISQRFETFLLKYITKNTIFTNFRTSNKIILIAYNLSYQLFHVQNIITSNYLKKIKNLQREKIQLKKIQDKLKQVEEKISQNKGKNNFFSTIEKLNSFEKMPKYTININISHAHFFYSSIYKFFLLLIYTF